METARISLQEVATLAKEFRAAGWAATANTLDGLLRLVYAAHDARRPTVPRGAHMLVHHDASVDALRRFDDALAIFPDDREPGAEGGSDDE